MRSNLDRYLALEHKEGSPKTSLYQPTSRSMPDAKADPILFKNLLQEAKIQLEEKYNRRVWEPLIKELEALQVDADFWTYSKEGLAVLIDESGMEVFRVDQSFEPSVTVEEHFYLLPLLEVYESLDAVYLLDLSKDRVSLYLVNQFTAEPVQQDKIITAFSELFDDFDAHADLNFGSYSGDGSGYHGHRSKPEEEEKERDKYFRYIDQALGEFIKGEDVPVLLAGTRDNLAHYRDLAKGNFYLQRQLEKPFASVDLKERRALLQEILKPRYQERVNKLLEDYSKKAADGLLVGGVENALPMAEHGRVETLFVQGDKGPEERMKVNELTEKVLLSGGEVVILQHDKLRGTVSATLRY